MDVIFDTQESHQQLYLTVFLKVSLKMRIVYIREFLQFMVRSLEFYVPGTEPPQHTIRRMELNAPCHFWLSSAIRAERGRSWRSLAERH